MSDDILKGSAAGTGSPDGDDAPCASVKECQAKKTQAQKDIDKMDCAQLQDKIDEYVNRERAPGVKYETKGLRYRFPEQINGNCGPGTKTWDNHQDQIIRQQANLQHALDAHQAKNCDPLPEDLQKDAEDYAGRQAPQDSDWLGGAGECLENSAPAPQPVPVPEATGNDAVDQQAAADAVKKVGEGVVAGGVLAGTVALIVRLLPFLVLVGA